MDTNNLNLRKEFILNLFIIICAVSFIFFSGLKYEYFQFRLIILGLFFISIYKFYYELINKYFTSQTASPFFGISYNLNNKTILKFEKDTIDTVRPHPTLVYSQRASDYSYGLDYAVNSNFSIGVSHERGDYLSIKFIYKNNPKRTFKQFEYEKANIEKDDSKYTRLIKNLEKNGIGVNKISETSKHVRKKISVPLSSF